MLTTKNFCNSLHLLAKVAILLLCAVQTQAADPPKIQRALPSGGQVGKTHEVVLTGTFPTWPIQFWSDTTDLTFQASETSGKISVTVAPQAEPGVRYFRAYDAVGATDLVPFLIDRCADVLEQEPNDHHAQAQQVQHLPASVHGCLEKSGDVDTFQVTLSQGQTLIASLDGQRFLGSPMDADIQVLTARGVVLAQQLDHHGLDPELRFTAQADGNYLIRLLAFPDTPNSTIAYAGGEKYVYRLMLTNGPFIDTTSPACLSRQQENVLQLLGTNIQLDKRQLVLPAMDSTASDRKWFSVDGYQGIVNLPITNSAVFVETEPNELSAPQSIAIPAIVTGCVASSGDKDSFQFQSEKGKRWKLSVEAREFGSPLDAVLTIFNSDGKQLATSDDVGGNLDAKISFVAPADGSFTVSVHDMYRQGSSQHWYRLIVLPEVPDYSLAITGNAFTGKVGKPIEIVVNVDRKLDFASDVKLSLEQPLPSGTNPQVVSKKADDTGKSVKLVVQSDQPFSGPIRIVGSSEPGINRIAKPDKSDCTWLWLTISK